MRHILVANAKGGCGKSTVATNLAVYYATGGARVVLADFDPQATSLDWLETRPADRAPILGLPAFEDGFRHLPRDTEIVIIDAPARSHGRELSDLVRRSETVIVPVLPSAIDTRAASRFVDELLHVSAVERHKARVAVIANRMRENTIAFDELDTFLRAIKAPYIATLRETQNYVRAYSKGLGVFELPQYRAWPDWDQWQPLVDWLERS